MRAAVRHPSSQRKRSDARLEDSNLGTDVSPGATVEYRTLRSDDWRVPTSLAKMGPREKNTTADKSRTAVQDTSTEHEPDRDVAEPDDRAAMILALFARKESLAIVDALLLTDDAKTQLHRIGPLLLSSHGVLDSFARLVTEGALIVSEGVLKVTPLGERILESLPKVSE